MLHHREHHAIGCRDTNSGRPAHHHVTDCIRCLLRGGEANKLHPGRKQALIKQVECIILPHDGIIASDYFIGKKLHYVITITGTVYLFKVV